MIRKKRKSPPTLSELTISIEGNHNALIVLPNITFEDGATSMDIFLIPRRVFARCSHNNAENGKCFYE